MLSLLLAAAADHAPIYWQDLNLSRYLFKIGSFELRWYSLAYLAGIVLGFWHLSRMMKVPGAPLAQRHADDLFFYCTLGIILGGRLGYALFYSPDFYLIKHPLELAKLWEGGMSFHGGLLGVLLAIAWVSRSGGLSFLRVCDYIAVCVPFGMLFGRLANFVNGELWGRVTESYVPWAMVFPDAPGGLPRHPSQLYEAGLEGVLLFAILAFAVYRLKWLQRRGAIVATFLIAYGLFRLSLENVRNPDLGMPDFPLGLTMGMLLSTPMILVGGWLMWKALKEPVEAHEPA